MKDNRESISGVLGCTQTCEKKALPMLSVTVMMLRLMVESVMLLKDED